MVLHGSLLWAPCESLQDKLSFISMARFQCDLKNLATKFIFKSSIYAQFIYFPVTGYFQ